jgi:thioesterase domain-containing protein
MSTLPPPHLQRWPHLSVMSWGNRGPAIVLFPGVGGYAMIFRGLAQRFARDQKVLAVQLPGSDLDEPCVRYSIEETTQLLLPQIMAACPQGPMVLVGYSMGVLPAYELGTIFSRAGRSQTLVSLDGAAPQYHRQMKMTRGLGEIARVLQCESGARLRSWRGGLSARWGIGSARPVDQLRERERRMLYLRELAVVQYEPRVRNSTSLLLIKSRVGPSRSVSKREDPRYGWGAYVDEVSEICVLPGDHESLIQSPSNQGAIVDAISRHAASVFGSSA